MWKKVKEPLQARKIKSVLFIILQYLNKNQHLLFTQTLLDYFNTTSYTWQTFKSPSMILAIFL
jgi:hypothetical protein